jgi:hypothetical protein
MVNLLTTLSLSHNFTYFSRLKDLVRMSPVWSSVGHYFNSIDPFSTRRLMKWKCTSICLVHSWKTGFLTSLITSWLSQNMGVGCVRCFCISESILLRQTSSHAPFIAPRYSTSINQRVVACWFLFVHVTTPMHRMKKYPKVDFLSST